MRAAVRAASPGPGSFRSFNCFGCAPGNDKGLRLEFTERGEGVSAPVRLGPDYESFPTTIHGGIVAAVLDEGMGRAVYRRTGEPGVTVGMRVRFVAPLRTDAAYTVHASVVAQTEHGVKARAEVEDAGGALMASADATFVLVAESVLDARRRAAGASA